jgi:hypothetical protein
LLFIYGRSTSLGVQSPPTAPMGVNVTIEGAQLIVTWVDASQGAATNYRVDFRAGHQDGGAVIASATTGSTSLAVAIPPGVSGAFNVVVTGLNAAGAGPPSLRHDFTLSPAGAAPCAAPPPAVSDVTGVVNGGFARVQWAPVPAATSYLIQAGSVVGGADLYALSDVGSSTTAGAAVPPGFRAWVRVVAANGCGRSAPTDVFVQ